MKNKDCKNSHSTVQAERSKGWQLLYIDTEKKKATLGTIHVLPKQRTGWVQEMAIFAYVQFIKHAGWWVGGWVKKKAQKPADVIYEWSLRGYILEYLNFWLHIQTKAQHCDH